MKWVGITGLGTYTIYVYHMWQSRVEIKHYSVAYFDCGTAFEVLQRGTSVKGGAHTHWVNS